ncbi:hypothetical protein [Salinispora arenicola]|uniref:Uncharacterized protein n=1 Tax=Salinispora arenicola TaxID=168697 RepID=A0A542XK29_SALAC|nr:hypothetical protein [Salinispora arenicola]MCN0153213.1 hypothetical protein [Salinispora arenicola]NIL42929.1 hypothetical protein [Salinispora arenicola]NIL58779.1 hypothetical protein [Salinispora arenicola]NIL64416.1 hypothetical protein [Salinispora arenicola]TQL36212.1 hypothetical protein FB564_1298 [Salinispora arenicola]
MGLDNVVVNWPRTGRFYNPVAPAEFVDFGEIVDMPQISAPTAALAELIAKTGTVRATAYTELVDLILGLENVLYATENAAEDEDPVIDPDGCGWIADGLERFVARHRTVGEAITFDTVSEVLRALLGDGRLAEQQLRWLGSRLDRLRDDNGDPPQWTFTCAELSVLAAFYRRCADRGFAVYAESAAPRRAVQP